ncbi:RagB/SusD family nutrient uptake outer membrane protein [Echinicola soli]|uniref:RagB/SusD family nutrient uptake outer membrane protein n=1 Tax=Echinicola soli TaxID=2591634 RepID=A0A514CKB8_9BACT|nr:RagB/SusD family nutrient uptake outer membrane protein [Echinicola soli]QDH80263.1 RagB/SusD family nutrient uptake outer membrane protein [Echinicola soli]
MNNVRLSLIYIALFFALSSCESFLEEENRQTLTNENAFSNSQVFDQMVAHAYAKLRTAISFTDPDLYGTDLVTRNSPVIGVDQLNDYVNFSATNWPVTNYWSNYFQVVTAANVVISRLPEITGVAQEESSVGLAEAKFLRALAYFRLVEHFGDLPIVLEEITTATTQFTRESEQVVYQQILQDLDGAISALPESRAEYGRATNAAARHLKAKVLLTRGYKDFGSSEDFSKAAELVEAVMDHHPLEPSFSNVVDIENQRNDEVIFAMLFGGDPQSIGTGNYRHKYFKFDYDVYPGMERTALYNQGLGNTLTPYYFSLYQQEDQRAQESFRRVIYALVDDQEAGIAKGDTAIYFPVNSWSEQDKAAKKYAVINPDEYFTNDGYTMVHYPMFKKFDDPEVTYSAAGREPKGERDAVVFRSAETLLIGAEAHYKLGELEKAAGLLNILRNRAGIEVPLVAGDINLDFILDESARELMGETSRWMDLKRTNKLVERVLEHNPHAALNQAIRPHHLLRPIPQSEIDLSNNSLSQNEGYLF